MRCELRDSLDNLYPDSVIGRRPRTAMRIDVPRGGIASVHILIQQLQPGTPLAFSASANGRTLPTAEWFRLVDVPVEENTGLIGFTEATRNLSSFPSDKVANRPNPYVVRRAPFRTYDAMQPAARQLTVTNPTLALRLQLPISRTTRAGERRIDIGLRQGAAATTLAVTIHCHAVSLPPPGQSTMPVTNWFSYETIAERHGLKLWSAAYYRMLRQYADLMVHGRQNAFWIPLRSIFSDTPAGPQLNRARLCRIVETFTAAGMHYIEGGHVAGRTGGEWQAETFDVVFGGVRATTPAGNAVLASICRQLQQEIAANGWQDRWIQHVTDEPTATNAVDYRILVGMVRKYLPGVPLLDASQDTTLVGSVDMWCPQVHEYQRDREAYETQRALGDQVWYYTCCFPGGPWLNRLLDQELLRPALLGWAGALYRLDGFLHWGLNHYRDADVPFAQTVLRNHAGGSNNLPPGDTHIVYPGSGGPWSSLRLESHREGFEDCELLRRLQQGQPARAAAILKRVIRAFDDYTTDVKTYRAARRALFQAVSRTS